jgi:hypothetical protein
MSSVLGPAGFRTIEDAIPGLAKSVRLYPGIAFDIIPQ